MKRHVDDTTETTTDNDPHNLDRNVRRYSYRLACGEVWSGNQRGVHSLQLPGLLGWVSSVPLEPAQGGGDIHYLSVCDEGNLSRVALADVSGHGQGVSLMAERLLGLMRAYINTFEQSELLHELSQAFQTIRSAGPLTFATGVLIGFDRLTGRLSFTNAGHPPPLWYRAAARRWSWLEEQASRSRSVATSLPLGLGLNASYPETKVRLGRGDMLILYTDGVSEATDRAGRELGVDRLQALARSLPRDSPAAAGETLLAYLRAFRNGTSPRDDETVIVLQRPAGSISG